MEKLRSAAKELHKKIKLIAQEISSKEKEISKLRQANSELIEANLEKVRKPKSLEVQRNQIVKIDVEILELKIVESSLQEKLNKSDANIRREKLREQINGFYELSKSQLQTVESVRRNIRTLEKSLLELEKVSGRGGSVYNLLQILWNNSEAKELIDLKEVLQNWSVSNINLALPIELETRLLQFNNQLFGIWNQLNAVHTNSRTYPSVKKLKAVNRSPLGKNQIRALEAGAEAKKVREKPVTPFMHSFPQAPPG